MLPRSVLLNRLLNVLCRCEPRVPPVKTASIVKKPKTNMKTSEQSAGGKGGIYETDSQNNSLVKHAGRPVTARACTAASGTISPILFIRIFLQISAQFSPGHTPTTNQEGRRPERVSIEAHEASRPHLLAHAAGSTLPTTTWTQPSGSRV